MEKLGSTHLADIIDAYLVGQDRVDYIPLMPGLSYDKQNIPKNKKWKIIENTDFESDI